MAKYIWQHDIDGESDRLRLMSGILDRSSQQHLQRLPIQKNWKCIEIGAGNGSLSQWLATQLGANGSVIATDIAPDLLKGIERDNLEVRALDVVKEGLDDATYDLVVVRALLHHLPQRMDVLASMTKALKPGGWLFVHEPDFYPCLTVDPVEQAAFWHNFIAWSADHQIDFFIGRKIAPQLQRLGLLRIESEGHTTQYSGGTQYARWWQLGIAAGAEQMLADGAVRRAQLEQFFALYDDPAYWTMTIAFTAVTAQRAMA